MFDMFITGMENENDIDVKMSCVSTFLKIQTNFSKYRPNTDQFLTSFWKGLYYRPKLFLQTTVSSLHGKLIKAWSHLRTFRTQYRKFQHLHFLFGLCVSQDKHKIRWDFWHMRGNNKSDYNSCHGKGPNEQDSRLYAAMERTRNAN